MRHEPLDPDAGAAVTEGEPWRRGEPQNGTRQRVALILRSTAGHEGLVAGMEAAGLDVRLEDTALSAITEDAAFFALADAVVVEIDPASSSAVEAFDRLVHLAAGRIAVIAAVEGLTVAQTRMLLKAGAVDALPMPFTPEELRHALEPVRRTARPAARSGGAHQRQGRIISFMGALGGVGGTAIATQAGILMAAQKRTLFLDLDIQFGNSALYLDLRPSLTLGHLIEDEERLDAELMESVSMRHGSGLNLIASPSDMMPLESINIEFVDRILRLAMQSYDIVIVDLPTAWTEWSLRVIERSDIACLVTNLSVPGIHQARRQLEIIEANNLMDKLRIVANRVQNKLFGRVDLKETEAVLGRKIDYTITNDYPTMSAALDEGRPVGDVRSGGRMVKDLKALVESLSTVLASEGAPRL
ncbi:AAA family ATPase [Sandaracinobacteroides sp. A072]|uniref:AAA family ATPase n=1 Tax=Sandaracinobacteroides sp. A072 TaxID=3461146 RepID=UPI0040429412